MTVSGVRNSWVILVYSHLDVEVVFRFAPDVRRVGCPDAQAVFSGGQVMEGDLVAGAVEVPVLVVAFEFPGKPNGFGQQVIGQRQADAAGRQRDLLQVLQVENLFDPRFAVGTEPGDLGDQQRVIALRKRL